MQVSDLISLGALMISILAIIKSSKKYELSVTQRSDLMSWHKEVVALLIKVRECLCAKVEFNKVDYLAQLSTLIEQGRFYFPNIESKSGYGKEKPLAYRGFREATLEFLVFSYDIIKNEKAENYTDHLCRLQRLFTSSIFHILQPRKHNKLVEKFTSLRLDRGINSIDFMMSDPELYKFYSDSTKGRHLPF
ncbi:MAG: hypothetical protein LBM75_10365 [Myxococcales bacterium]|jgi:hypothetical protein|nr:hypothetical protein [Myxococcales bacterium]